MEDESSIFWGDYWDIIAGILFGFLAFYFHHVHSLPLVATAFAAIAIGSVSVTISEVAEILAHRLGEPYGSLILTFSAIFVEIFILFMVILESIEHPEALETVKNGMISTVLVDLNILLGLSMFLGGLNVKEQQHNEEASSSFSVILFVAAAMLLVPSTLSMAKETEESIVLEASILISILLFVFYIFIFKFQTMTHTNFFQHKKPTKKMLEKKAQREKNYFFEKRSNMQNGFFLFLFLGFVGFLSEIFAKDGMAVFLDFGVSAGFAGIIIALITVAPELFTAIKAAKDDEIQRVVNIAMGASTASILLVVPVLMALALMFNVNLLLDFTPLQIGALIITIFLVWKTTENGETNYLEGLSHIMLFLSYAVIAMFY